jgi:hypothetical protein
MFNFDMVFKKMTLVPGFWYRVTLKLPERAALDGLYS